MVSSLHPIIYFIFNDFYTYVDVCTIPIPLSDINYDAMTLCLDLTIHRANIKSVSLLQEPGICLSCTFLVGSTGDGCAVRLQNDQHTFIFIASRHDNEALECFLVPDTGVYSVHVYDVQYGEVQEHTSRLLDQVIIEKRDDEYYRVYCDNSFPCRVQLEACCN